jgi:hypothetical protein
MTHTYHLLNDWITYAARSNVCFRLPMAGLASCCGIALSQTP